MVNRRKRKRKSRVTAKQQRLVNALIRMKVASNLSQKQLLDVINNFVDEEESKFLTKLVRKEFADGYRAHRLHGCTTCNDFVWIHSETMDCPNCANSDGRYDVEGNAQEEVFYFALLPRLEKMYEDAEWRHSLLYPDNRPRRATQRSDVFDGTEYKRLRRTVGQCDHFVTFAHVADAVSSNKRMSRSVLPGILRFVTTNFANLSDFTNLPNNLTYLIQRSELRSKSKISPT